MTRCNSLVTATRPTAQRDSQCHIYTCEQFKVFPAQTLHTSLISELRWLCLIVNFPETDKLTIMLQAWGGGKEADFELLS